MMTHRVPALVLCLSLALPSTASSITQAGAVACGTQVIDRLEREMADFEREATAVALDGMVDDTTRLTRNQLKQNLGRPVTKDEVIRGEIKTQVQRLNNWAAFVRETQASTTEINRCLQSGAASNCLPDAIKRGGAVIVRWMKVLANEGLNAATQRVAPFERVMRDFVAKTAGSATGSTMDAMNDCAAEYEQLARSLPSSPTPPVSAAPARTGPSGTRIALGTLAAVGIGVGTFVATGLGNTDSSTTTTTGPPPTTPTQTTVVSSRITCTMNSAGTARNCNGFIEAIIGPSVTGGTIITAQTSPSGIIGRATPTSTGGSQRITFQIQNSSIQITLTGSVPPCPSAQTSVGFFPASNPNVAVAQATGSMPVSCN